MGTFFKRHGILLYTSVVVIIFIGIKFVAHHFRLEFIPVNPILNSLIAGATFICGFLLAGVLADYKESERVPAEIRGSMENIWEEASSFKKQNPQFDLEKTRDNLKGILRAFFEGIKKTDFNSCLGLIDSLSARFDEMAKLGFLPNYVVRLKAEQGNIRRMVLRVYHMQKTTFLPSAYMLGESMVFLIVMILLFVKTEPYYEGIFLFTIVSYMFIYITKLIRTVETPFKEGEDSMDEVSHFLMHDFESELDK